ncbi:MAG: hypothetical protein Q4Q06_01355 [Bacteroidota bacterium]|nr:hypothetical protein [Bacteroidota bacterium]
MKRFCLLFVLLFVFSFLYAQEVNIFDYDPCIEQVGKNQKKQFKKAYSFFQDHKFQKASLILTDMIRKDEAFASVYFLMGIIGVSTDNANMIRRYFPLCLKECEEYSHPLLWYYMGIINYSNENYMEAQKNFQQFMSLSEEKQEYDSLRNSAINYLNWGDFLYRTTNNPVSFFPKKIDYLADNTNYYQPFITADEKEIYFLRQEVIMDTIRDSFLASSSLRKEIKSGRATLDTNDYYDRGLVLPFPFNDAKTEGRVSLTADNSLLVFAKREKDIWNMYYCYRYGDYFSEPKPMNINSQEADDMQPFITWDGNSLFFVSNRKGGKGGYDIYLSNRKNENENEWSEPINLGSNINTPFDESFPFLSFDDSVLYFLSNGHKTIGGTDIFYKPLSQNSIANNMGYPINTEYNEGNIGVLLDGKTAYLTHKSEGEKYHTIKTFTLPSFAQTNACKLKQGKTIFEVETNTTLDLFNFTKNNFHHINIEPERPYFSLVLEENSSYFLSFNKLGYMFYTNKIKNNEDTIIVEIKPIESKQNMALKNIELTPSNTDFSQESFIAVIMPFMNFLSNNANVRVNISSNEKILRVLEKHLLNKGIRKDRFVLKKAESNDIFYEIQ